MGEASRVHDRNHLVNPSHNISLPRSSAHYTHAIPCCRGEILWVRPVDVFLFARAYACDLARSPAMADSSLRLKHQLQGFSKETGCWEIDLPHVPMKARELSG